jgi:hypothetical protein
VLLAYRIPFSVPLGLWSIERYASRACSRSFFAQNTLGVVIMGLQDRRDLRPRDNRDSRSRDSIRAYRHLPGGECAKRNLCGNENPSSLRSRSEVIIGAGQIIGRLEESSVLRQVIPRRSSVDAGVSPMPPGGSPVNGIVSRSGMLRPLCSGYACPHVGESPGCSTSCAMPATEFRNEKLRIRSLHWLLKPHTMLGERFRISPLIKNKSISHQFSRSVHSLKARKRVEVQSSRSIKANRQPGLSPTGSRCVMRLTVSLKGGNPHARVPSYLAAVDPFLIWGDKITLRLSTFEGIFCPFRGV